MTDDLERQAAAVGATVRRVQPRIGAEIHGLDLREPLDAARRDFVWSALMRHRVLFFRDQAIDRAQHVGFARNFGDLEIHPLNKGKDPYYQVEYPEILPVKTKLSPLQEEGDAHDLTANNWHTDMTCRPRPPKAAILRGVAVPPLGGDTLWCCAASAYRGLDEATKARIENLTAEHDLAPALAPYLKTEEEIERVRRENPVREHPVVRIHPDTGERLLFVNSGLTTRIVGLPPEESRRLLGRLFAQFERPEYQVRFSWAPNSIAFWDERATQHYAVQGFEGIDERILERICIEGDEPVGPASVREAA